MEAACAAAVAEVDGPQVDVESLSSPSTSSGLPRPNPTRSSSPARTGARCGPGNGGPGTGRPQSPRPVRRRSGHTTDLRHTAVALWIAQGGSPKQIATWAGHTSVSVVLDRYGHLFPGHEATVMERLEAGYTAPAKPSKAEVRRLPGVASSPE